MLFHWTKETAFKGYTCRDDKGYARAIVTGPNVHRFYYGEVFTRGRPDAGPFLLSSEAADWVTATLVEMKLVPSDSQFGALPVTA